MVTRGGYGCCCSCNEKKAEAPSLTLQFDALVKSVQEFLRKGVASSVEHNLSLCNLLVAASDSNAYSLSRPRVTTSLIFEAFELMT